MDDVFDDIAFLANSQNRIAVFQLLVEGPKSRDVLLRQLDASRVTITRILRELQARGWIKRTGQEYVVSPSGDWVFEAFTDLVDEVAAEQRLRDPLQWLPTDLLTFDVKCLRDAELIRLDASDPTLLFRRIVEFHQSGDRIRGIARGAAPVFLENHWELTIHGNTHLDLVLTPDALDTLLNHPPSTELLIDMLNVDNAQYYIHDQIPISLGIVNGSVGINLTDADGVLKGGLVTTHERVYSWAVDLFETCLEQARPVDPDTIDA